MVCKRRAIKYVEAHLSILTAKWVINLWYGYCNIINRLIYGGGVFVGWVYILLV